MGRIIALKYAVQHSEHGTRWANIEVHATLSAARERYNGFKLLYPGAHWRVIARERRTGRIRVFAHNRGHSNATTKIGKFLLATAKEQDQLVTVYRGERGSFFIKRHGRKVYVHEVGWGYRDSQRYKKNRRSYQVVRLGGSAAPRHRIGWQDTYPLGRPKRRR